MLDENTVMLKNVRVSFPHLFKKPVIKGDEGPYGANFMIHPEDNKVDLAAVKTIIRARISGDLKGIKLPPEKICLRNGEDKGRPEYDGYMILSANTQKKPYVLAGDGRTFIQDEDDSKIYAGCYVNAKVRLWAQNNDFGKRINCELIAVQFAGDGEALSSNHITPEAAAEGFGGSSDFNDEYDVIEEDISF